MRKFIVILIILIGFPVFAKTITGEVKKETSINTNRIYDSTSNKPIEGAIVKIPSIRYSTITDKNGTFKLTTKVNSPAIMSVEKDGYKPFSMSLTENKKDPIVIGIEKTTPNDIIIETDMIHLGDDSFSINSAHAYDFSLTSIGSIYSKEFKITPLEENEEVFLSIGSIIGIDTIQAQKMGQSHVRTAYASPPEIFCNGHKIAEIKINGDNQKIQIPKSILKGIDIINISIKTVKNLYILSYIDFDDIEFTNLLLEIK